jgi:hypothetical protein
MKSKGLRTWFVIHFVIDFISTLSLNPRAPALQLRRLFFQGEPHVT